MGEKRGCWQGKKRTMRTCNAILCAKITLGADTDLGSDLVHHRGF